MTLAVSLVVLAIGLLASYVFSTLAYSLRDFSRAALGAWFERRGRPEMLEALIACEEELLLTAAVLRAAANLAIVLAVLHTTSLLLTDPSIALLYGVTFFASFVLIGLIGVALPLATAEHAAEPFIGAFARMLHLKRLALLPIVKLHRPLDSLVRRITGHGPAGDLEEVEEEIQQEILDIVAEGRQEGVIDDAERQMIERALRFHDATAGEAMTARPEIVGLPVDASVEQILELIDETGHSRIPVYEGNLDRIVGVLYARDLFRFVGKRLNGHTDTATGTRQFDIHSVLRQPLFVPETQPLSDLLRDFQLQKVHMALVLDEYGGTAGLVTIEDVLEELVGEIADEHELDEDPRFRRLDEHTAEADARLEVEELNRLLGLKLPEEEGFETVGGFVTTTLGQIPPIGATFEQETPAGRAVFTVLDAEPQRVNRVRIEVQPVVALAEASENGDPGRRQE